jgi:pilus assembly protein Flp/PilA
MAEGRRELPKIGSAVFGVLTGQTASNAAKRRKLSMVTKPFKPAFRMRTLLNEEGQDLIEYALVVALIAFAATAGMSSLAASINNAFLGVGTTLSNYIT